MPFAPFDIFDWIVRLLPGAIVSAVIESTVAISRMFGVTNISAAAKAGDQTIAIAGLLATGVTAGAGLFAVLSLSGEPALVFGGILGGTLGGLALIAERQLQRLPPGSIVPGIWVCATFLAWGIAFGWVHDRWRETRLSTAGPHDDQGRRTFLKTLAVASGAVTLVSTVAGLLASRIGERFSGRRWSDDHALPNAGAVVMPVPGTRAEFTPIQDFYRIDTDTRAPALDASGWRLAIGGLVDRPGRMTLGELRAIESLDVFATLCCISNPPGGDLISTTRWTGVSLQRLLPRLSLRQAATHLKVTSADGFFESIALDAIRADERVMLCHSWDGVPLPVEHGYPARLFVPDVYGMKQPKWVVAIDAVAQWEPGYWVARGWSREGRVATSSAIDVAVVDQSHGGLLNAGGIAFAGARGVSKVEVRVDDGAWQEARVRTPLSPAAWVIWRAALTVDAGPHVLTVRAFDGNGEPQQAAFHSRRVAV